MAARRRPHTTGETIPLGPGVPAHLRPARQAPGELRHSPFGGKDRDVLGGCLGGSRRARPSRNERAYQMVHHRKNQGHPGYRLPGQPRYTRSETAPLRPGVQDTQRGRPGAPSSKTSSLKDRFQSRPRHARKPMLREERVMAAVTISSAPGPGCTVRRPRTAVTTVRIRAALRSTTISFICITSPDCFGPKVSASAAPPRPAGRRRRPRVLGPGVPGVPAPQLGAHLPVGPGPERAQVVGHRDRPPGR